MSATFGYAAIKEAKDDLRREFGDFAENNAAIPARVAELVAIEVASPVAAAQAAADAAEQARDAAQALSNMVDDKAAGVAAALPFFSTPGSGDTAAILWRATAGDAVEFGRQPSKAALDSSLISPRRAIGFRRTVDWSNGGYSHYGANATGQVVAREIGAAGRERWGGNAYFPTELTAADREVAGYAKGLRRTVDWLNMNLPHMQANDAGQLLVRTGADGKRAAWGGTAYLTPLYPGDVTGGGAGGSVASGPRPTVDWSNIGAPAYRANTAGQLIGYTARGVALDWNGGGYAASLPPLQQPFNAPASYAVREEIGQALARFAAAYGLALPAITAAQPTPQASSAPILSRDKGVYTPFTNWQIPCIARVGQRFFRSNYGRNDIPMGPPGGEGAPCYAALAYSDNDCATFTTEAFLVPRPYNPPAVTQGVLDPHIFAMPSGKLAWLAPITGADGGLNGNARAVYGCLLANPLAAPSACTFGPISYLGRGFVGKPSMHGNEVRFTCADTVADALIYMRLREVNDILVSDVISTVPDPEAGGYTRDYAEASHVPFGRDGVLLYMRANEGYLQTRSLHGGAPGTWSTPQLLPFFATTRSRCDLLRSPSGRLVFLHNFPISGSVGRNYGGIALSEDDGLTYRVDYNFDPRTTISYFSGCFGANLDGTYDGKIYDAYDRGRNKEADGSAPGGYLGQLVVAKLDEESIAAGAPLPTIIDTSVLPNG